MNLSEVVNTMHGWCTSEKATRLFNLVKETDSMVTIELGVFGGRSMIPMAMAHKEKGSGCVIGVDAWLASVSTEGTNAKSNDEFWRNINYKDIYDSCQVAIYKNGVEDFCNTVRMRSQDAGKLIADNIVDILHQDSGHNVETITAELSQWIPKLKVGGYWIADDTDWKEAKDGYSYLSENGLVLVEDYEKWQIWKKVK